MARMRVTSRLLRTALAAALLLNLAPLAFAREGAQQVKAEIDGLQKSLRDNPVSDKNLASLVSTTRSTLDAAKRELAAGRLYLSLEDLGRAEALLLGLRAVVDEADVQKRGLPAFESRWNKAGLALSALDRQAGARDWSHSPAAIRALSEAAQGRSIPLLDGGRGFAIATTPADGLFYIGQAEGEAEFARFAVGINVARTQQAVRLRSMLPELKMLQDKTDAAFQPPKSIDEHPRFIALNSTLKLARELDARMFYAGALYEYLEAVRNYGMLDAPPLDTRAQSRLKADLKAASKKIAASSADDSIAQLFVQRAESYIHQPDGSLPTPDEWRSARIIVDEVLPAYFAAQLAPAVASPAAEKAVTITLVRWPYT
jgi:hypothetical protein